jgi:oligoendopeptidase F
MMAERHTAFTFHSTLPLAETASTFSEMLLVDHLLAQENDAEVRRDILFRQMDESYATIMRQAYFAMFERQAHDLVSKDASVDELSAAYMENLKQQFGESLEISDEFKWEWISIPHIYSTPFYVYAYTFGQLLVLSLYKQYKSEGESFKPRYVKILEAGGSAAPAKILTNAGIDINKAEIWQGGFDVLDNMLKDLEAIPIIH